MFLSSCMYCNCSIWYIFRNLFLIALNLRFLFGLPTDLIRASLTSLMQTNLFVFFIQNMLLKLTSPLILRYLMDSVYHYVSWSWAGFDPWCQVLVTSVDFFLPLAYFFFSFAFSLMVHENVCKNKLMDYLSFAMSIKKKYWCCFSNISVINCLWLQIC